MPNAHSYEEMYKELGIGLDDLGCVMLNLKLTPRFQEIRDGFKEDMYVSKNPKRHWIRGWVASDPHLTLFYGLLADAKEWALHIKDLISDIELNFLKVENVGFFESPYEDEPYYCIVANIVPSEALMEMHKRIEFLPHINTFTEYRPHITLCYLKKEKGEAYRDFAIRQFADMLRGEELQARGINFGERKSKDA